MISGCKMIFLKYFKNGQRGFLESKGGGKKEKKVVLAGCLLLWLSILIVAGVKFSANVPIKHLKEVLEGL
jgi:hypothetical protein